MKCEEGIAQGSHGAPTAYDTQGRVIKTSQPMSTGADAGARVTTYYTGTGSAPCGGRPEWADAVCQVGPAGVITGGGTNPAQLVTTTTEYDAWGNPAKVSEVANGITRVSTTTYDGAGRPTVSAVTGGLGTAVASTTTAYDPATGQATTQTASTGGVITRVYDALGRQISYTDADAGVTSTRYDALDRPTQVVDGAPSTTTYTYDPAIEPGVDRRLV